MLGVTSAIIHDKRVQSKNETYAVKLRITHQRVQRYFPIGIRLTIDEWENTQLQNPRGKFKEYKLYFSKIEARAQEIIHNLDEFTFEDFEKTFIAKAPSQKEVFVLFEKYISNLKKQDRVSTASSYTDALSSLKKFAVFKGQKKILLKDITVEWLSEFENWKTGEGSSPSTVGIYLRYLRNIINIEIENGNFKKEKYPFGKRRYTIPASRNVKKALTIEQIKKVVQFQPDNKHKKRARDLWIFSYLANGINMKDMAHLQFKDIGLKSIVFVRAKTHLTSKKDIKPIVVPILPEITRIIDLWGSKNKDPNNHVFEMIEASDSITDQTKKIKQATKVINEHMKSIGKELGFELKLTTYVARHSYATVLKRSGAPIEFISESLGHKDLKTTENYLDSFEDETREKFQRKLLDF